jgi:hypothetical protein
MTKTIVLLLALPLGISCAFNLIHVFGDFVNGLDLFHYFFLGGAVFSLFVVAKFKQQLEFFSTFEHELTHNIWAMLFFIKPMGFHVNTDGSGLFEYRNGGNKFSEIFISLSPYFFPTACYLWLPFHVMCKEEYYWFYFMMMIFPKLAAPIKTGFVQSTRTVSSLVLSSLSISSFSSSMTGSTRVASRLQEDINRISIERKKNLIIL